MKMKRRGTWLAVVLAGGLFVAQAPESRAQEVPFDARIDLQLFDYSLGPKSFFSVNNAEVAAPEQYSMDFMMTFLTDPFTVYDVDSREDEIIGTRTEVVDSLFAGQIGGAYGLFEGVQIGAMLPLVFAMNGDGLDPSTGRMSSDNLQVSGLGDLRVEAKHKVWEQDAYRFAYSGAVSLPTSFGAGGSEHQSGSDFLGDDLPDVRGRAMLQWTHPDGKITAAANAGVILRKPRKIYSSTIGQQLTYGAAGAYDINERVSVVGEAFGRTGLADLDVDSSPLELGGGVRVAATRSINVVAGGGAGVLRGIGSPGLRAFLSVGYAPDLRDQDGDGIPNLEDQCPLLAEDRDGFEDADGCPDEDNDGDRREDSVDQCPNEAEDLDGFEDDDGCPEKDNDKDGFLDFDDSCPTQAEDGEPPFPKDGCPADARDSDDDGLMDNVDACPEEYEDEDGFEDGDGCPDHDNDGDGIPDLDDQCPLCAEDKDGFEDDDGCPELDNDGDGVADSSDQCPDEAEVVNGVEDFDGCPDSGGKTVARMEGDRLLVDAAIRFKRGGELRSAGVVDQAALVMLQHPEVTRWRVVVANKKRRSEAKTKAESQRQADAIKAQLESRGVAGGSIEAIGAVSDSALIAFVVLERGAADGDAASICPAQFKATPREKAPRAKAKAEDDADADAGAEEADAGAEEADADE